jgi:hypothetical protein
VLREGDGCAEGKMEVFAVKMPRACVRVHSWSLGFSPPVLDVVDVESI